MSVGGYLISSANFFFDIGLHIFEVASWYLFSSDLSAAPD
jgi:hypothetical protein